MSILSKRLKKMIQIGYWPGFIVGMYPSQFAYKPIEVPQKEVWKETKEINLYFHIPFCKFKCPYCTFFSIVKDEEAYFKKYIDKLIDELRLYESYFEDKVNIKSICFGGGTPNIIPAKYYKEIFKVLRSGKFYDDIALEPSMEISPELISEEYIKEIKEAGIRRLSLGVQSLKKELRKSINRGIDVDIREIIQLIRQYELSINIDLINGLPGQSKEDFMMTLYEIVKIAPETISIYLMSGKDSSVLKKSDNLMTTKERYELFDIYYDYLVNNGYRCESHVKFVKCNQGSTHQQKIYEYQGVETLGIGCGARSYNRHIHYALPYSQDRKTSHVAIDKYIEEPFEDFKWCGYKMNVEENKRRAIIYSFFMGALDLREYKERFESNPVEEFAAEFEALFDNELIMQQDTLIKLTKKGRKYTDLVGTLFWSPAVNALFRGDEGVK